MGATLKAGFTKAHTLISDTFGLSRQVAFSVVVLALLVITFAVFWFFHSAPPDTITITSGPKGSIFEMNAEKYGKILARNGVRLKILPSEGAFENLKRLANPSFPADIGFVQGGIADGLNINNLVSLGSIYYQPLLVFYRSRAPLHLLSQMSGKRLAIGPQGSGTRSLALTLLAVNGIKPGGATTLLDMDADDAARALPGGGIDAAFLSGDSASVENIRNLLLAPGIRLFDFTQADGYTRRINYLNELEFPEGSLDFGKDVPDHDVYLVAPAIELIARKNLHPALSDLLIEAAQEVHGSAALFRHRGEFPSPMEHEFSISSDASRYYKSGKSFLYRSLPFWLASLVNRFIVVFVPAVVILVPGLQIIPGVYKWRIMMRIYRWYNSLLMLEKELSVPLTADGREELLGRLADLEKSVNNMKVPPSFANQFYGLRTHISFVREHLMEKSSGLKP